MSRKRAPFQSSVTINGGRSSRAAICSSSSTSCDVDGIQLQVCEVTNPLFERFEPTLRNQLESQKSASVFLFQNMSSPHPLSPRRPKQHRYRTRRKPDPHGHPVLQHANTVTTPSIDHESRPSAHIRSRSLSAGEMDDAEPPAAMRVSPSLTAPSPSPLPLSAPSLNLSPFASPTASPRGLSSSVRVSGTNHKMHLLSFPDGLDAETQSVSVSLPSSPINQKRGAKATDSAPAIRVMVRFRPSSPSELQHDDIAVPFPADIAVLRDSTKCKLHFYCGPKRSKGGGTGSSHKRYTFSFDRIFGADSTQRAVFESVALPLCQEVVAGQTANVCLFCYGQSGSGKTYTMFGDTVRAEVYYGRSVCLIWCLMLSRKMMVCNGCIA